MDRAARLRQPGRRDDGERVRAAPERGRRGRRGGWRAAPRHDAGPAGATRRPTASGGTASGTLGIVLGAAGLVLGAAALVVALRRRPREAT